MMLCRIGQALLVTSLITIGACSESSIRSDVDKEATPGGPYTQANDAAPVRTIAAADVADSPLRPDPILSAGNKSPYTVRGVTYNILDDATGYRVQGLASWYGTKFHGHKTSNGEIYDLYAPTAAHKTLPIPSYARVTNLDNGHSVVVRVNDRGPFHADRVIDLSYAAAIKLGYMEKGTARVEVEAIDVTGVDDRRGTVSGDYRYLQVGAFGAETSAQRMRDELALALSSPVSVSAVRSGEELLYRVRVGPMTAADELENTQRQLQELGYNPGQPLP
jgi:rare lipoprotein A